jgi:hypothetical protein
MWSYMPPQSSQTRKIAVDFHAGLCMSVLIRPVTYVCARLTSDDWGWSETTPLGTIQETAGRWLP